MSTLVMVAAVVVGGGSLLLFAVFLFAGGLNLVPMDLSESSVFAWDGLLSILFFLQHSCMLRRPFRSRLSRIISPAYHATLFAIASGLTLLAVAGLWQISDVSLYAFQGLPRKLLRGAFGVAMAGFAWGGLSLRSFDPFGRTSVLVHRRGERLMPQQFTIQGPYRWVRHPLYASTLLLIWSCPEMTADRLLFNLLWSGWIFAGTVLEERDLLEDFGEAYLTYQHQVPMFIPRRKRARIL